MENRPLAEDRIKRSPWRMLAAGLIVAACALFVLGLYASFLSNRDATQRDFIEYWAAGQQLVHRANPYDPVGIMRLERGMGLKDRQPKVSLSPPTFLFLTLPLGLVGPKAGLILWLAILYSSLSVSIWLIWILNGRPSNGLQLCGYFFAPAVACLMAGQIGIFLLLGVTLFLYFYRTNPYLAGAALLPCTFKPHLFLPFAIVLALWIVHRKTYPVLAGFCTAVVVSMIPAVWLSGHVWSQYSRLMSEVEVVHEFVPTLSVALRFMLDRNALWLQFAPETAACLWAVWFYWTRRSTWNWMDRGLLVLLVSAVCTPYAWFSDEAMLLPAVLAGVYRATRFGRSLLPIGLLGAAALVEITILGHMASPYYLWTSPGWLFWYLYATRSRAPILRQDRHSMQAVETT